MDRLRRPPQRPNLGISSVESFTGRSRINLTPGHSLMDWIRLGREKGDLSGIGTKKRDVTVQELSTHNTDKDIWMAIKGKVYNITPYMKFHPGGSLQLIRAAGADGTPLFEEYHSWVNFESMLSKCYIGPLVLNADPAGTKGSFRTKRKTSVGNTFQPPAILATEHPLPTYDWYQTPEEVKVVIYTKVPDFQDNKVVVDISQSEVVIESYIKEFTYIVHFKPSEKLEDTCKVTSIKGKVEVSFTKKSEKNWSTIGSPLKLDKVFIRTKFAESRFWFWTAVSNTVVSHDTNLIGLRGPPGTRMVVPVGYHFIIHKAIQGMELARSYTVVISSLTSKDVPSADKDKLVYLLIKSYLGGAVSPWITGIKPGEKVKMNRFDGNFDLKMLNGKTHLIMFAAGTGFTSMIRVIHHAIFNMPKSPLQVHLVFFNKTEKDILWRDQLEELSQTSDRFHLSNVLSAPSESWKGLKGRVSAEHIKRFIPQPCSSDKPLLLVCGQYAYNDLVFGLAKAHGLQKESIHIFSNMNPS